MDWQRTESESEYAMLWIILIILLVILLVASVPTWPYSRGWGYSPSSIILAVVLILLLLWLLGVIEFNNGTNGTTTPAT